MAQSRVALDALEFRSPIAEFSKGDIFQRGDPTMHLEVSQVWQRRFSQLWRFVLDQTLIVPVTADRQVTTADSKSVILVSGTVTLTLPITSTPGDTYFFFNDSVGVVTIAGTINGNPAGRTLGSQYDYLQVTSKDGLANWIVTGKS